MNSPNVHKFVHPTGARLLLTGATGFLGRALALRLVREGYGLVAWVRSPERARSVLPAGTELVGTAGGRQALAGALEGVEAVIHLAGEPLVAQRWSQARRAELRASRIDSTRELVEALASAPRRPRVLLCASAVGWYGDRGDEELDERSPPGTGFLPELCAEWERAAQAAGDLGVRVVTLRTGLVLGAGGGALAPLLVPFRLGLGGRLGSGRQWMPWIHLEDWVELVVRALADERCRGALDLCAPQPVTNAEFTRTLAAVLQRPARLAVPAPLLHAALGARAELVLQSQRALPRRALELGHAFRFPALAPALRDLVGPRPEIRIERASGAPDVEYLRRAPPRWVLRQETRIPAPLEEVFAFFSAAENLGAITPPSMRFTVASPPPIAMHAGREIDYGLRLGPLALRWRSRIEVWEPGRRFVDSQVRGPYRSWWHEHRFERDGSGTRMQDEIWYAPPLGPLGAIAQHLVIARQLRAIFDYRSRAIALHFGRADDELSARG